MKRQRRQKGSLYFKDGCWRVRYTEYDSGRKTRPSHVLGTKEQYPRKGLALEAMQEFMRTVNDAGVVTYWEQLCDDYQRRGLSNARESTKATSYGVVIRKLRGAFEGDRLDWLATAPGRMKMEDWLNGAVISKGYRKMLRALITQIFQHARRWDMLKGENPSSLLKLNHSPRTTRPKRKRTVITAEQFRTVVGDPQLSELARTVFVTQMLTGLRGCEVLGLKWSEISLDDDPKIQITRSIRDRFIEDPKTEDSERTVALAPKLARVLLRWRSSAPQIDDWVFGSTDPRRRGLPWHYRTVQKDIKAAAERAGFDYKGFGLHNSRHTFRNNLKKTGASLEDQGKAMGHSKHNLEQTLAYGQDGVDHAAELAPLVERVAEMLLGEDEGGPLNCHLIATLDPQVLSNQQLDGQFTFSPIQRITENKGFGVISGKRKTA